MGDAMYQLALMWLILDLTGSSVITGLVALSAYLPAMLFGLFSGVLADRHDRLNLMILANISQALTVIMIPILLYLGVEHALYLGILAFIRSSFSTLFPPALNAFIPEIVPQTQLVKTNSVLATANQLAYLLGPALAGVLLGVISIRFLFIFDSASFLLALGFLALVSRPAVPVVTRQRPTTWKGLVKGFQYLRQYPTVGLLIGLTVLNNLFIMGPAIVGTPILVKEALGGTASQYAFVEAGLALGMLLGSIAIYRYGSRYKGGTLLLIGMVMDGVTYAIFYLAHSIPFVMVMIVIHALGIPMITISRTALIQRNTPNQFHGRLFAMVHLAVVGMTAFSSAIVGMLASVVSIQTVFLYFGIGGALCGFAGALVPQLRRMN